MGKTQTMAPASALDFCLLVVCNTHSFRPPSPLIFLTFLLGLGGRSLPFLFLSELIIIKPRNFSTDS